MLNRYQNGDHINEEDSQLLLELLERQVGEDKISDGVDFFYRAANPKWPSKSSFRIRRLDGSDTDFSFYDCIKGAKPTPEKYFYRACHYIASRRFETVKREWIDKGQPCALSGSKLTQENSEVRHDTPKFATILQSFISENALEISYSMFQPDSDAQIVVEFTDKALSKKFEDFHKKHAKLHVIKVR